MSILHLIINKSNPHEECYHKLITFLSQNGNIVLYDKGYSGLKIVLKNNIYKNFLRQTKMSVSKSNTSVRNGTTNIFYSADYVCVVYWRRKCKDLMSLIRFKA